MNMSRLKKFVEAEQKRTQMKICFHCDKQFDPNYLKRTVQPLICKPCFKKLEAV